SVGQSKWAEYFPDCGGKAQSPVDVATVQTQYDPSLDPLTPLGYGQHGNKPFSLYNNGHTGNYSNHADSITNNRHTCNYSNHADSISNNSHTGNYRNHADSITNNIHTGNYRNHADAITNNIQYDTPKKIKEKKTKEGKKIKKQKTVVEEEPDCEPPAPKKKKKKNKQEEVEKANREVNKSIDVNGNIEESPLKDNTSHSNEESADNDKETEKKKKKKKKNKKKTEEEVVVNGVLPETPKLIAQTNGHTAATTPGQSRSVGQSKWAEYFPDCGGKAQSPVDVATVQTQYDPSLGPLTPLGYGQHGNKPFSLYNNGHTGNYSNHADSITNNRHTGNYSNHADSITNNRHT
ncbi:unnamed protein product, partial [Coregonus sp. 'balchen']